MKFVQKGTTVRKIQVIRFHAHSEAIVLMDQVFVSCVRQALIAKKVRQLQYLVMLVAIVTLVRPNVLVVLLATLAEWVQLFLHHALLEVILQLDKALAKYVLLDLFVLRNQSHQRSVDRAFTV